MLIVDSFHFPGQHTRLLHTIAKYRQLADPETPMVTSHTIPNFSTDFHFIQSVYIFHEIPIEGISYSASLISSSQWSLYQQSLGFLF